MKKILIPTDHSDIADNAIDYAISLPKEMAEEVVLFHAGANVSEKFINLNKQANKLWERFKVEIVSSQKNFSIKNINHVIEKHNVDMVVMGTSGNDGSIVKKIFGNNTSSIIEDIPCPLIAVPVNYNGKGINKIGYASDFTDLEAEASVVVELAKKLDVLLEIFHVVPVYPDLYDTDSKDVSKTVEQLKRKFNYSNIYHIIEETKGDNELRQGVDQFIKHYHPDLLVMFHQNRSEIDRLISPSQTADLITHLEVPLMVFPKLNTYL